jgi:hypothetical protein
MYHYPSLKTDVLTIKKIVMKNLFKLTGYILFVMILSLSTQTVFGQNSNSVITDSLLIKSIGTWKGALSVQGTEVPLVFKVFKGDQNNLKVTLDSPLQNAFDIPLGGISNISGEIKIDAPMLQGNYTAKYVNDSTLNGTWYQAGNSFPLKLRKKNSGK